MVSYVHITTGSWWCGFGSFDTAEALEGYLHTTMMTMLQAQPATSKLMLNGSVLIAGSKWKNRETVLQLMANQARWQEAVLVNKLFLQPNDIHAHTARLMRLAMRSVGVANLQLIALIAYVHKLGQNAPVQFGVSAETIIETLLVAICNANKCTMASDMRVLLAQTPAHRTAFEALGKVDELQWLHSTFQNNLVDNPVFACAVLWRMLGTADFTTALPVMTKMTSITDAASVIGIPYVLEYIYVQSTWIGAHLPVVPLIVSWVLHHEQVTYVGPGGFKQMTLMSYPQWYVDEAVSSSEQVRLPPELALTQNVEAANAKIGKTELMKVVGKISGVSSPPSIKLDWRQALLYYLGRQEYTRRFATQAGYDLSELRQARGWLLLGKGSAKQTEALKTMATLLASRRQLMCLFLKWEMWSMLPPQEKDNVEPPYPAQLPSYLDNGYVMFVEGRHMAEWAAAIATKPKNKPEKPTPATIYEYDTVGDCVKAHHDGWLLIVPKSFLMDHGISSSTLADMVMKGKLAENKVSQEKALVYLATMAVAGKNKKATAVVAPPLYYMVEPDAKTFTVCQGDWSMVVPNTMLQEYQVTKVEVCDVVKKFGIGLCGSGQNVALKMLKAVLDVGVFEIKKMETNA